MAYPGPRIRKGKPPCQSRISRALHDHERSPSAARCRYDLRLPMLFLGARGARFILTGAALVARTTDASADPSGEGPDNREAAPEARLTFLQYGVAFTGELVLSPGPTCDAARFAEPTAGANSNGSGAPPRCILGDGGGIAFRIGWRGAGPLYLGAAYEVSKQDPNKLYRLAILQQIRGEARYYIPTLRDVEPYAMGGLGIVGYGDEWGVDSIGLGPSLGAGIEWHATRTTVVGIGLSYRLLRMSGFTDSSRATRPDGFVHMIGLEASLEGKEPLQTQPAVTSP